MYGPIKAIAIDDEPSHLLAVTSALGAAGIPAAGLWFDKDNSVLRPAPPRGGFEHLRLVFSDLNLAEIGGVPDTQTLWSTVVTVLKEVVSPASGPYLLVFWTRIEANAAAVKQMLYDRAEQMGDIPLPIDVIEIPKNNYLVKPVEGESFDEQLRSYYSELHSKMGALRALLDEAVKRDVRVGALSAWEARAAEAASLAVNEVARCALIDVDGVSSEAGSSIALTLSKIAVSASGRGAAEANPAKALDLGLIDIAVDKFGSTVGDQEYRGMVEAAILNDVRAKTPFKKRERMAAELNSFFQVDRSIEGVDPLDRGSVIYVDSLGGSGGGFDPSHYMASEFFFHVDDVKATLKQQHATDLAAIAASRSAVLVELGADCDHAQANPRTNRFLLGFCLSKKYEYLFKNKNGLANGALELLGPWMIGDEETYLLVSCRRYWAWQEAVLRPAEIAFRLRATVVEKLLHRYASWTSRRGVVEFR